MRSPPDIASLLPAMEAAGWQKMEVAPRDGSYFVAFPAYRWERGYDDDFPYVICHWGEAMGDPEEDDYVEAGWHDSEGALGTNLRLWFPLPHIFGRSG